VKTAFALLLSCAALCLAQESKTENVKRLVSVTWDLATHKLICVVEKGALVNGEFVPSAEAKYEVSPDDAFMALGGEKRSFGEEEAANLHLLLDVLSRYCVDSVVWWDHGNPDPTAPAPGPVTKPEQPAQPKPSIAPIGKPVKVAQRKAPQPSGVKDTELVTATGH
jgi:hypothetical protein